MQLRKTGLIGVMALSLMQVSALGQANWADVALHLFKRTESAVTGAYRAVVLGAGHTVVFGFLISYTYSAWHKNNVQQELKKARAFFNISDGQQVYAQELEGMYNERRKNIFKSQLNFIKWCASHPMKKDAYSKKVLGWRDNEIFSRIHNKRLAELNDAYTVLKRNSPGSSSDNSSGDLLSFFFKK